ncbi:MAG: hypothetical protein CMB82_11890 [Flammeovirgaceae bacterium]|nr:hypothetical protein [Flammeovirgaceae bacterium]
MKSILMIIIIFSSQLLSAQKIKKAGIYLGADSNKGKPYVFGQQEAVNSVMNVARNYTLKDVDGMIENYSRAFGAQVIEDNRKWLNAMEQISMVPYRIIPVKIEDSNETLVLTWSVEDRKWKNGSKQTLDLMEIFKMNQNNKIIGFSQWARIDPKSQFGISSGGKFYGKKPNEDTGKSLVFSNRGEIEVLEKLFKDYNNMDGVACSQAFADQATMNGYDGTQSTLSKEDWYEMFDSYQSVEWKPYSIAPLKISDTDPISGATVFSKEKRIYKDGSVWEKELVEIFYFDLEGKIFNVVQYTRDFNS